MNQLSGRSVRSLAVAAPITERAGAAGPARSCGCQPIDPIGRRSPRDLPCHRNDPDLWFAESPADVERAKALCGTCPARAECLLGALRRSEPCGVWGGEIVQLGEVVPFKRPRGRPRIHFPAADDGMPRQRKYA